MSKIMQRKLITIAAILFAAVLSIIIIAKTEKKTEAYTGTTVMSINVNDPDPFANVKVVGGHESKMDSVGYFKIGAVIVIAAVSTAAVCITKKKTDTKTS